MKLAYSLALLPTIGGSVFMAMAMLAAEQGFTYLAGLLFISAVAAAWAIHISLRPCEPWPVADTRSVACDDWH